LVFRNLNSDKELKPDSMQLYFDSYKANKFDKYDMSEVGDLPTAS